MTRPTEGPTLTNSSDPEGTVEEQAAFWAVRTASPHCTPEDRRAFELWRRADPAHAAAYQRTQKANAFVDRHVDHEILKDLADRMRARTEPEKATLLRPLWRPTWNAAAIAASLMLVFGGAIGTFTVMASKQAAIETTAEAPASYETAIGERSTVTLSDGTVVTLNTNSRLSVAFTGKTRTVALLRGQAFFEVAKETARPFIVAAGGKRIVALGTAFDVRFDDADEVEVTLVEGRVAVDGVIENTGDRETAFSAPVELSPGERLVARAGAAPDVAPAPVEDLTSWRKGFLVFRDRPLVDVIDEMNRYSTQQLIIDDDARLMAMTISGVFNASRAQDFISALEIMRPLEAERSGVNEFTLVWRE